MYFGSRASPIRKLRQRVGGRKHLAAVAADEYTVSGLAEHLEHHLLLPGCGRVGRLAVSVLKTAPVQYLAMELDLEEFRHGKQPGYSVVPADGSLARMLDAAGRPCARLLVITFDHPRPLERILQGRRAVVFPENLAAGLPLGSQALLLLGIPQARQEHATALNPESCQAVG